MKHTSGTREASPRSHQFPHLFHQSQFHQSQSPPSQPSSPKTLQPAKATPAKFPKLLSLSLAALSSLGILLSSAAAQGQSLERQLDIRPFNGAGEAPMRSQREAADRLLRLGDQQVAYGRPDQAIASWTEALALYAELDDTVALGQTYDMIGLTYAELGQFDEAQAALRRRLAIARDNQDFRGQVLGWNNLGTVLMQAGNYPAARRAFEDALQVARDTGDPEGLGLSLSNLGLVSMATGDYVAAIQFYEEATSLRQRGGNPVGAANTWNNLGDAYRATGQYWRSTIAHRMALAIGREQDNRAVRLRALDGLIASHRANGEPQPVSGFLAERALLTQDGSDPQEALVTLRSLGEFYEADGDLETAQRFYQQALGLAEQLNQTQVAAQLRYRLSNLALGIRPQ